MAVPWIPYPPTDGGRVRSYYLLREAARRHEVELLCVRNPGESEAGLQALAPLCRRIDTVPSEVDYSVPAKAHALMRPWPFGAMAPESGIGRRLAAWGRDPGITVIHVQGMEFAASLPELVRHKPVVFDMVDCNSLQMRRRAGRVRDPLRRLWYHVQAGAFQRAEAAVSRLPLRVLVTSPVDAQALGPSGTVRIHVIPDGVEVDAGWNPGSGQDSARLVFTGNMGYTPNQDAVAYFCRAIWPLVRRARPEATFDVIGKNPPSKLAAWLARQPGVTVAGFVPDLKAEMATRTLYVCPLRIGSGIKVKLLEAMACGMPIVATPISIEGMPVEDGRHLLIAGSAEAFAAKVDQALSDPARCRELGRQARRLVQERYDWTALGQDVDRIYREAAS